MKSSALYVYLTEQGLLEIADMAKGGLSKKQIAERIGISLDTFKYWLDKYRNIRIAYGAGRRMAEEKAEEPKPAKKKGRRTKQSGGGAVVVKKKIYRHYDKRPDLLLWCDGRRAV